MFACISGEHVLSRTMQDWTALLLRAEKAGILGGFMCLRSNNGAAGRREAAELFLQGPCTHLQFIDSDQGFPAHLTTDLLAADKDIVAASYRRRGNGYDLMFFPLVEQAEYGGGCVEVLHAPTGLMLIERHVLEAQHPHDPWFVYDEDKDHPGQFHSEDTSFCFRARRYGFKVYTHMKLTTEAIHYATVGLEFR